MLYSPLPPLHRKGFSCFQGDACTSQVKEPFISSDSARFQPFKFYVAFGRLARTFYTRRFLKPSILTKISSYFLAVLRKFPSSTIKYARSLRSIAFHSLTIVSADFTVGGQLNDLRKPHCRSQFRYELCLIHSLIRTVATLLTACVTAASAFCQRHKELHA